MSTKLKVLVTGATGQQGGAVARVLHRDGHSVRAITRNPESDQAKVLASQDIELVTGDFNDPGTLTQAAEGFDAAYLMGTPFENGPAAETEHGQQAIDGLKAAGIGHIVYSSVGSADQKTGIPHFDSKYAVEQHLVASGVPYTISAPVFFMDNHTSPWTQPPLSSGQLAMAVPADRKLQYIALADIGDFGAHLIERRDSVFGKRYDIAGDELTGTETAAVLSKASGQTIDYSQVPIEVIRGMSEDLALMFEFFANVGYSADIAALRRDFPEVRWHSLSDWAANVDWASHGFNAAAA
jgi:uncharacterized protein YbjT (DUF2867 family)